MEAEFENNEKSTTPNDLEVLKAMDEKERELFQKAVNKTMNKECFTEGELSNIVEEIEKPRKISLIYLTLS